MKEWTIDTWVLYRVNEGDFDALAFIAVVLVKHCVVFDHEGHIEDEYRRCFQRTRNPYLVQWFNRLVRGGGRTVHYSGKLSRRHEQALLRMNFDRSDFPFVAVASRSKDKLLVSEDSDYTDIVCDYLSRELQVQVLKVNQASNLATHDP